MSAFEVEAEVPTGTAAEVGPHHDVGARCLAAVAFPPIPIPGRSRERGEQEEGEDDQLSHGNS